MARSASRKQPAASSAGPRKSRARRAGRTNSTGGRTKRLRAVTDLAISMEVLADEVLSAYRKWIADPPRTEELRRKCAEAMRRLSAHGDSVLVQYRHVASVIATEGGESDGPPADPASEAFDIAEAAGGERLLGRLVEVLLTVAGRMEIPFTAENQREIIDMWRAMNKFAEQVKTIAEAVQERCRTGAISLRLPREVQGGLDTVKQKVEETLTSMAGVFGETSTPAVDVCSRLDAMTERASRLAEVFRGLKMPLKAFVSHQLKTIKGADISLANDLDYLLERVGFLLGSANDLFEFAAGHLDAARTLDPDIDEKARNLKDAVCEMRDEYDAVKAMIATRREIVARAPFRHFRRAKPLSEWGDLSSKEQEYVAVLVRLRHGDPDGEYAVATQAAIESAMGLTAGRRPSVTVLRWLKRLDVERQIVRVFPQDPTAERQQKTNLFWIAEDAYATYAPHVLGGDGTATRVT